MTDLDAGQTTSFAGDSPRAPPPRPESGDADLVLLRAFEPIVRYTKGELFQPLAVDPYVAYCSLWRGEANGQETCIVPGGAVSLDGLSEAGIAHQDRPLSLRLCASRSAAATIAAGVTLGPTA